MVGSRLAGAFDLPFAALRVVHYYDATFRKIKRAVYDVLPDPADRGEVSGAQPSVVLRTCCIEALVFTGTTSRLVQVHDLFSYRHLLVFQYVEGVRSLVVHD